MSRVGKLSINIPDNVKIDLNNEKVKVSGPHGQLEEFIETFFNVEHTDGTLTVVPKGYDIKKAKTIPKKVKALWGLRRTLINNMVHGVVNKFSKSLLVNGVGYKSQVKGKFLYLNLGYSHPIVVLIPQDVEVKVEQNKITLSGISKKKVGDFAAKLRSLRKPEPYKGKGVKYEDENIRRKEGKKS
jgi:large subunit ribosomal protein L6